MFKNQLQKIRKDNNLTQKQMSKMLNISPTGYAGWEQGRSQPNVEDIKKLCVIFDITADELLEIDTEERRNKIHVNNSFNNNGKININQ